METNMSCPDCKDGFYYPLIGKPEPCQTCANKAIKVHNLRNHPDSNIRGTHSAIFKNQLQFDFENHLLVRLKDIDLDGIQITSLSNGIKFYLEYVIRDREIAARNIGNDPIKYADYFYEIIRINLDITFGGNKIDFRFANIAYDAEKSGVRMTLTFYRESV